SSADGRAGLSPRDSKDMYTFAVKGGAVAQARRVRPIERGLSGSACRPNQPQGAATNAVEGKVLAAQAAMVCGMRNFMHSLQAFMPTLRRMQPSIIYGKP